MRRERQTEDRRQREKEREREKTGGEDSSQICMIACSRFLLKGLSRRTVQNTSERSRLHGSEKKEQDASFNGGGILGRICLGSGSFASRGFHLGSRHQHLDAFLFFFFSDFASGTEVPRPRQGEPASRLMETSDSAGSSQTSGTYRSCCSFPGKRIS